MRSSQLWNRGGGTTAGSSSSLFHRDASLSASSSFESATAAASRPLSSSLPLQQHQTAGISSSHKKNDDSSNTKLHTRHATKSSLTSFWLASSSSWLVSNIYKMGRMRLLLLSLPVVTIATFWISHHYIVSTTSSSSSSIPVNAWHHHKSSSISSRPRFVVPENMMIRLDDLPNHGGLPPLLRDVRRGKKPDFGSVEKLRIMQDDDLPRRLHHHVDEHVNTYLKPGSGDDVVDWYYLVDDDVKRNPYVIFNDDKLKNERLCRRTAWQQDMYLNCNTFHEFDFQTVVLNQKAKHIGAGSYRDAFKAETELDSLVFKESSYSQSHEKYNYEDYHFVRKDMIVAAQLQPHPLFVETYGWCQLSLFGELAPRGDVTNAIVPRYERCNETFSSMNHRDKLIPMNDLSPSRKLEYALQMTESIAVLNNYKHGVIVHDDVQLPQWLMVDDGKGGIRLKLNDFNRMEVMYFDEANQEYCKYRNYPGAGDWRAPQEYFDYPLDEKIDIWSLSNNFYALLTGLYPFYQECRSKNVQKRVKNKETPYINPKWKTHSYAEGVLVDLMKQGWAYEPEDRIDISQLVQRLREAVAENKKRQREYLLEKARKQKEEAEQERRKESQERE